MVMARKDMDWPPNDQRVHFVQTTPLPDWSVHENKSLPRPLIAPQIVLEPLQLLSVDSVERASARILLFGVEGDEVQAAIVKGPKTCAIARLIDAPARSVPNVVVPRYVHKRALERRN